MLNSPVVRMLKRAVLPVSTHRWRALWHTLASDQGCVGDCSSPKAHLGKQLALRFRYPQRAQFRFPARNPDSSSLPVQTLGCSRCIDLDGPSSCVPVTYIGDWIEFPAPDSRPTTAIAAISVLWEQTSIHLCQLFLCLCLSIILYITNKIFCPCILVDQNLCKPAPWPLV